MAKHPYVQENMRTNLLHKYDNKCANCASAEQLQFHHIVPLSKGGIHSESNMVVLCYKCHQKVHEEIRIPKGGGRKRKLSKLPLEFVEKIFTDYLECRIGAIELKSLLDVRKHPSDLDEFKKFMKKLGVTEHRNNIDLIKKIGRDGLKNGKTVGYAIYQNLKVCYTWQGD